MVRFRNDDRCIHHDCVKNWFTLSDLQPHYQIFITGFIDTLLFMSISIESQESKIIEYLFLEQKRLRNQIENVCGVSF